ncbi:MAG TPA: carboxypeptidase-like regulatory domain-containing protein, partial [Prosthecochloris aestuarii]|nr:carboxypeptidase-like regulatory domain-containing protein [Prosthecochloris aestuarii]
MEHRHFPVSPLARSLFSVCLLMLLLVPQHLVAADTGSITGTVTDKTGGQAVIGASVMLETTTLGAATDFEGNYTISNIPAGSYAVKVTGEGYTPQTGTVTVTAGQATTFNLQLSETTIMASEIVVGAALY